MVTGCCQCFRWDPPQLLNFENDAIEGLSFERLSAIKVPDAHVSPFVVAKCNEGLSGEPSPHPSPGQPPEIQRCEMADRTFVYSSSHQHPIEPPETRHTPQLVLAPVLELYV